MVAIVLYAVAALLFLVGAIGWTIGSLDLLLCGLACFAAAHIPWKR